jgi:two-component system, sensor histidine kinase and response regulator
VSPLIAPQSASVMVVDDNPANLKLMGDMLGRQGYEVRLFPRGRLALASAAQRVPDLVLLDINMPEMDGYQVCQQFKADSRLAPIPIIFLSALRETEDKVKGLESGGVDYISKPFQFEEVQARVEIHLRLHHLQNALQRQNERLEEVVAARTRELADAHSRLKILDEAKTDFLRLISHEFRTPLNGLLGVGGLLLDELPPTAHNRELVEMFDASRERILAILEDALLLTQIDVEGPSPSLTATSLAHVVHRAIQGCAAIGRANGVDFDVPEVSDCFIQGNENLLITALQALTEAAIWFASARSLIRFRYQIGDGSVCLLIEAHGKTIPATFLDRFFDVFSVSEAALSGVNVGLRPAVASRIVALSGGRVSVDNTEGPGIRFTASFRLLSGRI